MPPQVRSRPEGASDAVRAVKTYSMCVKGPRPEGANYASPGQNALGKGPVHTISSPDGATQSHPQPHPPRPTPRHRVCIALQMSRGGAIDWRCLDRCCCAGSTGSSGQHGLPFEIPRLIGRRDKDPYHPPLLCFSSSARIKVSLRRAQPFAGFFPLYAPCHSHARASLKARTGRGRGLQKSAAQGGGRERVRAEPNKIY
jgi:hypothetical protein